MKSKEIMGISHAAGTCNFIWVMMKHLLINPNA